MFTRLAGRASAGGICRVRNAVIIAGPTDRIVDRLARRQKTKTIRPSVIVRAAIGLLTAQVNRVRSVVGGSRTTLVWTILTNHDASGEWMIVGRKADGVSVPVPSGESLDILVEHQNVGRKWVVRSECTARPC